MIVIIGNTIVFVTIITVFINVLIAVLMIVII